MLTLFVACVGFVIGGLGGAAWAVIILYTLIVLLAMFGG